MIDEDIINKLESILIDSLSEAEGWRTMTNDIEIYYRMKTLVIGTFECVLCIMPVQIKAKVETIMGKLNDAGCVCEYEDWLCFLKFAQILSTSLLSDLDNRKIKDFATPHKIVGILDAAIRLDEKQYSEMSLPEMGARLNLGLFKIKAVVGNTDWKEGWNC